MENMGSISLKSTVDRIIASSPIIKKNKGELEKSKTLYKQVEASKILPHRTFELRSGIVPDAKGDATYSPDDKFSFKKWGPFIQGDLELMQPLFTFGRISSAENGARELINIRELQNNQDLKNLCGIGVQTYWGAYAADKASRIAVDLNQAYDTLIASIKNEIDKEESDLDQSYLFEALSYEYVIKSLSAETESQKRIARDAYQELTGEDAYVGKVFSDTVSPTFYSDDSKIDTALKIAYSTNLEIAMLESGIKGLDSKIEFNGSNKKPLIYLAGGIRYAYAPNREKQNNPFAYDNFNYLELGAFVGARWNLNFSAANIEIEESEAEKSALMQSLALLKSKIRIEVSKSYLDAKNGYNKLAQIRKSLQAAESWATMAYSNWSDGIGEADRMIKAMSSYFQLKAKEIEQEYNYNIALAEFALKINNIDNYLKWIKDGKIIL
jgi:outer membrane protein TolC